MTTNRYLTSWDDSDDSYMKLLFKEPTAKYPNGLYILGANRFPIGDFDNLDIPPIDEPARIYETAHGYRVFFTGRYNPNLPTMCDDLVSMGGDPQYSRFVKMRNYYACRVSPKSLTPKEGDSVARLVLETSPGLSEWDRFIQYHDGLVGAQNLYGDLV